MSKKAICIGCNYPGRRGQLNGCVNDALWHQQFAASLGYQVTLMTDTGYGIYPSKAALVQYFQHMVQNARAGDNLYISFSGHGTQVPDRTGMEADGLDEAICPADFHDTKIVLLDDELNYIFSSLPQGCMLTCFFDCCHSGTIMDLDYILDGTTGKKMKKMKKDKKNKKKKDKKQKHSFGGGMLNRSIDFFDISGMNYYAGPTMQGFMPPPHPGGGPMLDPGGAHSNMLGITRTPIFCFSGCRDDQSALDVSSGNTSFGLFTNALRSVMQTAPSCDYSTMFRYCQEHISRDMRHGDQNIQFSFNHISDPNLSIFLVQAGPPITNFSGQDWMHGAAQQYGLPQGSPQQFAMPHGSHQQYSMPHGYPQQYGQMPYSAQGYVQGYPYRGGDSSDDEHGKKKKKNSKKKK